jgi:hypothetical protein
MNNTHMSQFIPPSQIQKSAGTWTPTLSTHLVSDVRSAASAGFNLFIPIPVPSNSEYRAGSKLVSIDVLWKNATADLSNCATVSLKKQTLSAHGSAVTGADVAVTVDTNNDTEAKRVTQADHKMTVTLDTPVYVDDDEGYVLYIAITAATSSAFQLFGAVANYQLRV